MGEHAPPRVLRSKHLRNALYVAAEGRCERCGRDLGPDWEADHVLAWSVARRTNVHELRATCRACNRKKGKMSFRRFQIDMQRTAQDIVAGDPRRMIVLDAYPGAGKSAAPVILASEMLGKVIGNRRVDHICWVVPRLTLQEQAMDAFLDPFWRELLGHELRIRKSTNDVQPSRNLAGHATTYNAIAANNRILLQEFERRNYLLVLDEPHHVVEGGEFDIALRPLMDRAVLVLLQSGTLYRASQHEAIAFLPYERTGTKRIPIAVSNDRAIYIKYTLDEALKEQALKHLEFELLDTTAEWRARPGAPLTAVDSLLGLSREQGGDALFTALRTEFAHQLLRQAVVHWNAYRARHSRAKLLVVAPTQKLAREYLRHITEKLKVARADLATSDESDQARANIDRFKLSPDDPNALDVLVTVAMAYEGLDVPSVTHLAVLTHIRSLGWITQMLARAQRVDRQDGRDALSQRGWVFAPRDEFFDDIVAMIKQAQDRGAVKDPDTTDPQSGGGSPNPREPVMPTSSGRNEQDVAVDTADRSLTVERLSYVRELMTRHGWQGVSAVEVDALLRDHDAARAARSAAEAQNEAEVAAQSARAARSAATRRPNEEENELRTYITRITNRMDAEKNLPPGTTNGQLLTRFRKPRPQMTLDELREVYEFLMRQFNDESSTAAD